MALERASFTNNKQKAVESVELDYTDFYVQSDLAPHSSQNNSWSQTAG